MLTFNDVSKWQTKLIREQLERLYKLTVDLPKEKVVVELGVLVGRSTRALLAAVNDSGGHLHSVDKSDIYGVREQLKNEKNWTFIMGDDLQVVKKWNKEIDHLFIDTTHFFEQTLKELKAWGAWLKPQGIITLHDTDSNYDVLDGVSGVRRAIYQYLREKPTHEFINFEGEGGLGLIRPKRTKQ